MKKIGLFLCSLLSMGLSFTQSLNVDWAKGYGGKGDDRGNKICVDKKGNFIVTGRFDSKELRFGEVLLLNASRDTSTTDMFIAKFSPDGKLIWARNFGGQGGELGLHITCDPFNNLLIAGCFDSDTIRFGNYEFSNKTTVGDGSDIFLLKLDPGGEVLWAKSFGGERHDSYYDTCIPDKYGNIYYTGSFYSQVLPVDTILLTNSGKGSETFIAKFNPEGKVLWAKTCKGVNDDMPQSCALDPNGNLIVTGYFMGASFKADSVELVNTGEKTSDIFVLKYHPSGNLAWAKRFGGSGTELATCATDYKGNIFLAGMFTDSILTLGSSTCINAGEGDILLFKLDTDANVVWAVQAGGTSFDGVRNFCVDRKGNSILTGSFFSADLLFGDTVLKNVGESENIFICSYSTRGKFRWGISAGGKGRNAGRSCVVSNNGSVMVTGSFEETMLSIGNTQVKNEGSSDVFLVKLKAGK